MKSIIINKIYCRSAICQPGICIEINLWMSFSKNSAAGIEWSDHGL